MYQLQLVIPNLDDRNQTLCSAGRESKISFRVPDFLRFIDRHSKLDDLCMELASQLIAENAKHKLEKLSHLLFDHI